MSFYVIDHVAHLARLDVATQAAQKLVSAPGSLVDHEALGEPHVAGVRAEAVPDAALDDGLLENAIIHIATWVSMRSTSH